MAEAGPHGRPPTLPAYGKLSTQQRKDVRDYFRGIVLGDRQQHEAVKVADNCQGRMSASFKAFIEKTFDEVRCVRARVCAYFDDVPI